MISKHFAVLGDPIEHSLSPQIHSAAYAFMGLNWDYSRFQVPAGTLEDFVAGAGIELSGMSVTMPLKKEAAALANTVDSIVKLTGVANTLLREHSGFSAFNTDVYGITQALQSCLLGTVERVAILGAGATAVSALVAISQKAPAAKVTVFVRDEAKTLQIQQLAEVLDLHVDIANLNDTYLLNDLTISTLPQDVFAGISNAPSSGWLLNTSYAGANEAGSSTFNKDLIVDGRSMLLWQALAQIRIFVHGNPDASLKDEPEVFESMANSL